MESTLKSGIKIFHENDGGNFSSKVKQFTTSSEKKVAFNSTINPSISSSNLVSSLTPMPVSNKKTNKIDSNAKSTPGNKDLIEKAAKHEND